MNGEYWGIIAQISATFIGLVFVGQVFYLANIKDAVEVQIVQRFGFSEISTRAMVLCILTNLILFLYPLLVAVCLLTTEDRPSLIIWEFFWGVVIILIIILEIFIYADAREKFVTKKNNSSMPNRIVSRLKQGQVLIYIGVLLVTGLLMLLKVFSISFFESLLQFTVILLILIGLGLSIFDLIAFDKKNILFKKSEITRIISKANTQEFRLKRSLTENLYNTYIQAISSLRYQEWEGKKIQELESQSSQVSKNDVKEIIANEKKEREKLLNNCNVLIQANVWDSKYEFVRIFLRRTIYTSEEIFIFDGKYAKLMKEMDSLIVNLKERLSYLRENKIIETDENC